MKEGNVSTRPIPRLRVSPTGATTGWGTRSLQALATGPREQERKLWKMKDLGGSCKFRLCCGQPP